MTRKLKKTGLIISLSFLILFLLSATWLLAGGDLLIKNATILTVTGDVIPRGDVLVVNGLIKQSARISPLQPESELLKLTVDT